MQKNVFLKKHGLLFPCCVLGFLNLLFLFACVCVCDFVQLPQSFYDLCPIHTEVENLYSDWKYHFEKVPTHMKIPRA